MVSFRDTTRSIPTQTKQQNLHNNIYGLCPLNREPTMRLSTAFIFSASLILGGCSTSSLQTEIIPSAEIDISSYKTYAWDRPALILIGVLAGASSVDLEIRIKKAISKQMKMKGYQLVKSDQPHDLTVSFLVGAVTETQYSQHAFTKERWAYNSTFVWTQSNDTLKGALSIIINDPNIKDDIAWQGTAAENLKNNPNRNQETVEKFTEIILGYLPPSR